MEKNSTTRHVAIVEKCVMTEIDLDPPSPNSFCILS